MIHLASTDGTLHQIAGLFAGGCLSMTGRGGVRPSGPDRLRAGPGGRPRVAGLGPRWSLVRARAGAPRSRPRWVFFAQGRIFYAHDQNRPSRMPPVQRSDLPPHLRTPLRPMLPAKVAPHFSMRYSRSSPWSFAPNVRPGVHTVITTPPGPADSTARSRTHSIARLGGPPALLPFDLAPTLDHPLFRASPSFRPLSNHPPHRRPGPRIPPSRTISAFPSISSFP